MISQSELRLFLGTVVGVLFSGTVFGQPLFQKLYSIGDSLTIGNYISESSNGNVFVTGSVHQVNAKDEGVVWLVNPDGNPVWTLKVGRGTFNGVSLKGVVATPDGGCVFLANYAVSAIKNTSSIVKLNSAGAIEWVKKTAVSSDMEFREIQKITGGYLIVGINTGTGSPILKIDESGNYIWGNIINGFYAYTTDAFEFSNGDILVAGSGGKPKWMKLSSTGQVLSYYQYEDSTGFGGALHFDKCYQEGDSLIFIGGDYYTGTYIAVKTDMMGNLGSTARFSGPQEIWLIKTISDADHNYILSGRFGSAYQPIVVKISANFDAIWAKTYVKGNNSEQLFLDIAPSAAGGYWFAGDHIKDDRNVMYLARTDDNGEIPGGCCPKSVEIERLPCYIKKVDLGYTTTILPQIVDGAIITSWLQTEVTSFCEQSPAISLSDTIICPGKCIDISLKGAYSGNDYFWTFPGANPDTSNAINPGNVCYKGTGDYKILLEQDGCLIDSAFLKVDNTTDLFPNAFTPNADGVNETFKPIVTCPVDEYHFEIYNRWGEMVFATTDPATGWDGAINGRPAPVDVYVYRVQYFVLDGDVRTLVMNEMKEVSLIR